MVLRLEVGFRALAQSCNQSFPQSVHQAHREGTPQLLRRRQIVVQEVQLVVHFRG